MGASPRRGVIEIAVVKVRREGKVRFARIRFQSKSGIDCGILPTPGDWRVNRTCENRIIVRSASLQYAKRKAGSRAIA